MKNDVLESRCDSEHAPPPPPPCYNTKGQRRWIAQCHKEFVLDCFQLIKGTPQVKVHSTIGPRPYRNEAFLQEDNDTFIAVRRADDKTTVSNPLVLIADSIVSWNFSADLNTNGSTMSSASIMRRIPGLLMLLFGLPLSVLLGILIMCFIITELREIVATPPHH